MICGYFQILSEKFTKNNKIHNRKQETGDKANEETNIPPVTIRETFGSLVNITLLAVYVFKILFMRLFRNPSKEDHSRTVTGIVLSPIKTYKYCYRNTS